LPYALSIYNELYKRLAESRCRLFAKKRKYTCVRQLIDGINAAEEKIDTYYNKTYGNLWSLYGIGALLNPAVKGECFRKEFCWLDTQRDTRD
jgi:hypothetical protein